MLRTVYLTLWRSQPSSAQEYHMQVRAKSYFVNNFFFCFYLFF